MGHQHSVIFCRSKGKVAITGKGLTRQSSIGIKFTTRVGVDYYRGLGGEVDFCVSFHL